MTKKQLFLLLSTVFIIIGCVGTFARRPGIFSAFFMVGILFLILGSAQKTK